MSARAVNEEATPSGGTDPELEDLLELWDGLEEEADQPNALGITVLVGGVTYSGLLVPGRVWSRSMATLLRSAPENHQVRTVSGFFDQVSESFEKAGDAGDARRYLHLANVAIGLPNDGKRTSLLMRIRVSDVSAWTVGTIGELAPFSIPAPSAEG